MTSCFAASGATPLVLTYKFFLHVCAETHTLVGGWSKKFFALGCCRKKFLARGCFFVTEPAGETSVVWVGDGRWFT